MEYCKKYFPGVVVQLVGGGADVTRGRGRRRGGGRTRPVRGKEKEKKRKGVRWQGRVGGRSPRLRAGGRRGARETQGKGGKDGKERKSEERGERKRRQVEVSKEWIEAPSWL